VETLSLEPKGYQGIYLKINRKLKPQVLKKKFKLYNDESLHIFVGKVLVIF
jgi:hypothetical protein